MSSTRSAVIVVAGSVLLAGLSGCGRGGGDAGSSAACAAFLEYDGHTYRGVGAIKRDPALTDRSMPAVLLGCDDSGGQGRAAKDEPVRVSELADVAPTTAVFWHGVVFVRDGRALRQDTQRWFHAPRCGTTGTFGLTGDWLGVTGPNKIRFDGDVRPPYRLEVHVTTGPTRYVGARITVHASEATDPGLTPADVKASLWKGGQVSASVRCVRGRFAALALHT